MNGESKQNISFAEFELDPARRRLLRDGEPLALYAKAFDLLEFLLERNGQLVTKNEILETVWAGQFVEEANLSVQISALRKVLGEKKNAPRFLITVPGKGYKFVADIQNGGNEIVIEKHKVSRVVVEEKIENGEGRREEIGGLTEGRALPRRSFPASVVFAGLILIAFGIAGFWLLNRKGGFFPVSAVEKQPKIKKLTNDGRVSGAVLSADGKFVAYAVNNKPNWQSSIRLGQVDGSSDVVLRPVADIIYRVMSFSADGSSLYYTSAEPRQFVGALYKIPVLGGVPQKLADGISIYSVLSPDEKRIAFVDKNKENKDTALIIADTDGTNQHQLAVRPFDKSFNPSSLSWSADGRSIALAAANNFNNSDDAKQDYDVFVVSVADGGVNQLTNLEWNGITRVEWLKDGSGLAVIGRDRDSSFRDSIRRGLWSVDYPSGKARKISVDLDTYTGSLSLTANGSSILAVQGQSESNIWVSPADNLAASRQITFGSAGRIDGWYGLDWIPDGRIVYTAWIDQSSTIWVMDADGGGAKQITPVGFRDEQPIVTVDGATIVFQSDRSGGTQIWRMGTDGSNPRQLTKGEGINKYPSVSPDGRWVVYMNGRGGESSLWRVSIDGGEPIRIADHQSSYAQISPDGKFIACGYETNGKMSVAILPIDGGEPIKLFDVPKTYNASGPIRWTQDGRSLAYRDWANGIWLQPVEGGEPRRLAGLPEEKLLTYGWSRDGKQFAFTREKGTLDAVLITNFR